MPLPNFLIIGATKAGTTSIHHYLGQHPDIFVCKRKETNFFAQDSATCFLGDSIRTQEQYEQEFAEVKNEKAIGETSPAYLAVPAAPTNIHALIPHAKLIAILRNPTERAYSHFLMRRRQGREFRASFEQCIDEEDIDPERSYKHRGFYGEQLERYYKIFPKEQILVLLYEDFVDNPNNVLRTIFTFLGVDPTFEPDISERYNTNTAAEPLPPERKKKLIALYQEDIKKLEKLIGRDLSSWRA
ncbi:MAG TPA: sulfotransferase [Candidatus Peribacterales bacterium]|nr:sulfotransferase [Candidatus Peribacterales bacterium]